MSSMDKKRESFSKLGKKIQNLNVVLDINEDELKIIGKEKINILIAFSFLT